MSEGQKALALGLAVAVVIAAIAFLGTRALRLVAGDEATVVAQMKSLERGGFEALPLGVKLSGEKLDYQRMTVKTEAERISVTATLDFEGTFGERTKVSSLGLERVDFERRDRAWKATGGYAPLLVKTVEALEARRRRIESHKLRTDDVEQDDAARLNRMRELRFVVEHWYIRHEAERVQITEEGWLSGSLPEKPVYEKVTRRLWLEGATGTLRIAP
jgi:hypothetical protein